MGRIWQMDWANVDGTPDPGWFVRFIEDSRERSARAAKSNPKEFFAFLELQDGISILDVGCGTGFLDIPIAQLVAPSGRLVGVDASKAMIEQAWKRAAGSGLPIEFREGSVYQLGWPDGSFDRVMSNALFQHLDRPEAALGEMIRVAAPGGKVVLQDHDWGTFVIDATDQATTRKLLEFFSDSLADGWAARKAPSRMMDAGLEDVQVAASTIILNDLTLLEDFLVKPIQDPVVEAGVLGRGQFDAWRADLHERSARGRLLAGVTMLRTVGTKAGARASL